MAAGLLAIVVAAGGCSSGSDGGGKEERLPASEVASRLGYDVDGADLTPVFAVVPQYKDPRDGYARDLLARHCLEGTVEYRVAPPSGTDSFDERTGQAVFNTRIAARWGYSAQRLDVPPDAAVPDSVTITGEIEQKMAECGKAADRRLGLAPEKALSGIEEAGWNARSESSEIAEADAAWRECMLPAGVVDLPDGPHDMPTPSVTPSGAGREGTSVNSTTPPTAHEIEVAKADAACRDEVDYDATERRVRAEAELAAIGRDYERFEAARKAYEAYGKGVDEVISEYGG